MPDGGVITIAANIRELARRADEIDLAILDVVMPRAGGLEVYRHIQRTTSGIKVLLTSGYSPDLVHATDGEEVPLLSKPLRSEQLLDCIRQILDC